jgi:hypothetical protein
MAHFDKNEGLSMSGDQYRLDSGMYGLGGETGSAVEGSMGIEYNEHGYFAH